MKQYAATAFNTTILPRFHLFISFYFAAWDGEFIFKRKTVALGWVTIPLSILLGGVFVIMEQGKGQRTNTLLKIKSPTSRLARFV